MNESRPAILRSLQARLDKAIWEYHMFGDNERVLLAVSGGADSMALLYLLSKRLHIYARHLSLHAVYVDLGFGDGVDVRCRTMQEYGLQLQVPVHIVRTEIGPYAHSDANSENPCFLCTRIRRKHIFAAAEELACQKIVFGHHKDDLIETLLINMIFGREISTNPPVLSIKDGRYHILRPYVYTDEKLIKAFTREYAIPHFSQDCPTDGHSKRQYVKELIANLEKNFPGSRENLFFSMKKVKKDYLL
jgi:tRNA 2-thiocytidine biosynthesis protein TtcA